MVLIIIRMVTDMKAIGISIFRAESAHITILMEIFIRESGLMENPMVKVTTFTMGTKESTKAIGKMERSRDLENSLLMISTGTQESGGRIKKMVGDPTYIPMVKDTKVDGPRIKNKAGVSTDTEMAIFTMVIGRMIEDKDKEQ